MRKFLIFLLHEINQFVWGAPMLICFIGVGLYYSLRTGFFQVRGVPIWIRETFGKRKEKDSRAGFRALCTALAGTLGTGNIAGVATAITAGGPGAVFWMWVSAFLGMMTGFAEKCLGAKYGKGEGATMAYMEKGLGSKSLAIIYAILCAVTTAGAGNLVQVNSVAVAAEAAFSLPHLATAVLIAIPVFLVTVGGIRRISDFAEKLIPSLTVLYLLACFIVIGFHYKAIAPAFSSIWKGAFGLKAGLGGIAGYSMKKSVSLGLSRGIFSNEAGMGSSVLAYHDVGGKEPVSIGMWGMAEVFIDTFLVCTLTALVILTGGVYAPEIYGSAIASGNGMGLLDSSALTAASFFSVFGRFGDWFTAVSLYLFAFPSIICWCYYGTVCVGYVFGNRAKKIYKLIFILMIVIGSGVDSSLIWELVDTCNGLMSIPNLLTLAVLSPEVLKMFHESRLAI